MLLFGHRFIPSESFYHITTIDAISKTPPSSKVFLEFSEDNLDIIQHLTKNSVKFVLSVKNIRELIYASSLEASYILVQKEIAKNAQNIAESYLFDAKILVSLEDEDQIEEMAMLNLDGVLFPSAIIKIAKKVSKQSGV
jgi:hypothetical protein